MTSTTLIVLAHPDLASSRVHARLAEAARTVPHVTLHDVVARYPDGQVDPVHEQALLDRHEHVVWQFPWYWYSVPGALKTWMDRVLGMGYAYGPGGTALHGKTLRVVTSTGGPAASYGPTGHNRFTMDQLMAPLAATAHLCGMTMLDPHLLHGARTASDEDLALHAKRYRELLGG
jgi:glutathione-regulated potassium-efflux system ancillary protein KefG